MVCAQSWVKSYPGSTKYKYLPYKRLRHLFPTTYGCMLILSHATVHSQCENAYTYIKANLFLFLNGDVYIFYLAKAFTLYNCISAHPMYLHLAVYIIHFMDMY